MHSLTRSRVPRSFLLVASLAAGATAQVQNEWATTYVDPVANAAFDNTTSLAIASNGDVVWTSVASDIALFPQASTVHRNAANGAPLWSVQPAAIANTFLTQVFVDTNGDVYATGGTIRTNSPTYADDVIAAKLDASGALLWSNIVAGAPGKSDVARASLDASGVLTLVGTLDDGDRLFVRRLSANGVQLSHVEFNILGVGQEQLYAIASLPGGDFVIVGMNNSTRYVARIAATGAVAWVRSTPHPFVGAPAYQFDVVASPAGVIAVAGSNAISASTSVPRLDVYDLAGAWQWSDVFGASTAAYFGSFANVRFAPDGSLWACGQAHLSPSASDAVAVHYDAHGSRLGTFAHSPSGINVGGNATSLVVGEAGQAWILTNTFVPPSSYSSELLELSSEATLNWRFAFGGTYDLLWQFTLTSQRRFVSVGQFDPAGIGYVRQARVVQLDARAMPLGYCTAQVNSLGCTPQLSFAGRPLASATEGFTVRVDELINQKHGLFIYTAGVQASIPFHGGYMCMSTPRARALSVSTGGSVGPTPDCSGALSLDFRAFASGALGGSPLPALNVLGTKIQCQAWSRDSGTPTHSNLSSALEFTVLP
jgi:hypothetical protein